MDDPRKRRWWWIAFAWGLAESTFFFLVPDVWTSRVVLQDRRSGVLACAASVAGALVGGSLLFYLGCHAQVRDGVLAALDYLPGINPRVISDAALHLHLLGPEALFVGAVRGIPYKLYAIQAPGMEFTVFLVVSMLSRAGRFALVTALAWVIDAKILRNQPLERVLRIHAGSWAVFYLLYFWRMGL